MILGHRLNALGDDIDTQVKACLQNPPDNRLPGAVPLDIPHKEHVQLQVVGLELGEEIESRVTRPEVVNRDLHSRLLELAHRLGERIVIRYGFVLGHFEHER